MENIRKNKKIIFLCGILIIVFLVGFLLFGNKESENLEEEYEYLEKYSSNQFIPITITDNEMATKYLNDYKNILMNDLNEAYELLNKEYRTKKFNDYQAFEEYIKDKYSLEFYGTYVKKYKVERYDDDRLFYVYDSNDDLYIFREKSIMNYEVYLDDYTIVF